MEREISKDGDVLLTLGDVEGSAGERGTAVQWHAWCSRCMWSTGLAVPAPTLEKAEAAAVAAMNGHKCLGGVGG